MSEKLSASEIEKLILQAIDRNEESLSLSSCDVDRIPDIIGQATCLRSLSISGNRVKILPDSIGNLINLEKLFSNYLALKKGEDSTNKDSEQVKWIETGASIEQEESEPRNQHRGDPSSICTGRRSCS